jgi:hypothetical protein
MRPARAIPRSAHHSPCRHRACTGCLSWGTLSSTLPEGGGPSTSGPPARRCRPTLRRDHARARRRAGDRHAVPRVCHDCPALVDTSLPFGRVRGAARRRRGGMRRRPRNGPELRRPRAAVARGARASGRAGWHGRDRDRRRRRDAPPAARRGSHGAPGHRPPLRAARRARCGAQHRRRRRLSAAPRPRLEVGARLPVDRLRARRARPLARWGAGRCRRRALHLRARPRPGPGVARARPKSPGSTR